jgi:hypothetical protein
MQVTDLSEISVLRLKPRASKLLLPTLLLTGVSFALSFIAEQFSPADYEIALMAGALIFVLFWVFPLLSYLGSYLEITSERLIYRHSFLGIRKKELRLSDLASLELQKSPRLGIKAITIRSVDGKQWSIRGYARAKLLISEIEARAKATV